MASITETSISSSTEYDAEVENDTHRSCSSPSIQDRLNDLVEPRTRLEAIVALYLLADEAAAHHTLLG